MTEQLQGIVIQIFKGRVVCNGKAVGKVFYAESLEDLIAKGKAEINTRVANGESGEWGIEYK